VVGALHTDGGGSTRFRRAWRALIAVAAAVVVALVGAAWSLVSRAIPPRTVWIATGPDGSDFAEFGRRYRELLATSGVDLKLVPTAGAVENLAKLQDPGSGVSVGFAVAGLSGGKETRGLESLGTVAYEPLWLFERADARKFADVATFRRISIPRGTRVSIGPEGSSTRAVALQLLTLFGVRGGDVELLALEPQQSVEQLLAGKIDAFTLVASWDSPLVRKLAASPQVALVSFARADAFVALNPYLTKLVLPRGVADLRADLPSSDVFLVAPKASLVIRSDLHPAVQYLLLQAASRVHSGPGIFHRPRTFPAAEAIDIPLSDEATRYYTSGRPLLQRYLPFWLWVLAERLLVLLVPVLTVAYPLARFGPGMWNSMMQRRIILLYGELKVLETELDARASGAATADLAQRLDALSARAGHLRVPLQHTWMLYTLKGHIRSVGDRIAMHG